MNGQDGGAPARVTTTMLAALSLLAAITVGPERTPPVSMTVPDFALATVAAPVGRNFIVAWQQRHAVFAEIVDGSTGRPMTEHPTIVAMTPTSSTALAISSIGDRALVAWSGGYALLGADAQPQTVIALPARAVAVTAFGDRYLLLRSIAHGPIDARFIDATTGATIGSPFGVANASAAELAVASNGKTAFAIASDVDGHLASSTSFAIGGDSTVTAVPLPGSSPHVNKQSLHVIWDDVSYVVAWIESDITYDYPTILGCRVAAFDDRGNALGTPAFLDGLPFDEKPAGGGLVANASGSTLFLPDGRYRQLAPAGAPIDTMWKSLTQPPTIGCTAFNGRYLVVENEPWKRRSRH